MLRMRNYYCSECHRTQRFLDLGSHLVCEWCSKRLERVLPVAPPAAGKIVAWVERIEPRREAM